MKAYVMEEKLACILDIWEIRMYGSKKVIFCVSTAQSEFENCVHLIFFFERVFKTVESEKESNANYSRGREKAA